MADRTGEMPERLKIAMPFSRDNYFKFYLRRSVTELEWAQLMEIVALAKDACVEQVHRPEPNSKEQLK